MIFYILTNSEIDRVQWSALVQKSRTGTWFQTPEAYDFFASQPELFKAFAFAVSSKPELDSGAENEEKLRGVCVGYVTVEKNPIKQFFTRRAIIIGGPALADDATEEEVTALMTAVKENFQLSTFNFQLASPIYIETRNFNDYSRWKGAFEKAEFEYQPHLNFHVDCRDRESMWNRLSENRKRQVRRAQNTDRYADRIQITDIKEWYQILQELYRTKVKTPLFPLSFFWEAYKQNICRYLLVKHEGKVIGGSMLVQDEKSVYEWFECGLNKEYREQYPSVNATYAGMEYAHMQGVARYDMMGAGEPNKPYGVRDFKAEFGGELVEHGRWLFTAKPMMYKIGTLGVKILKKLS
ncbi:MAG: peptidoglycan bridge formation glycyltransferase FemA/FemB family protein [Paludibacteraceae bacterium]|nr:peptidoglycan bridge formation glycyltransferase FemA/FemB family protein [Paludibacteraceae bacterium]